MKIVGQIIKGTVVVEDVYGREQTLGKGQTIVLGDTIKAKSDEALILFDDNPEPVLFSGPAATEIDENFLGYLAKIAKENQEGVETTLASDIQEQDELEFVDAEDDTQQNDSELALPDTSINSIELFQNEIQGVTLEQQTVQEVSTQESSIQYSLVGEDGTYYVRGSDTEKLIVFAHARNGTLSDADNDRHFEVLDVDRGSVPVATINAVLQNTHLPLATTENVPSVVKEVVTVLQTLQNTDADITDVMLQTVLGVDFAEPLSTGELSYLNTRIDDAGLTPNDSDFLAQLSTLSTEVYNGVLSPTTLDLLSTSDTGTSHTDNITKDNTPTFSMGLAADASAGDVVSIYDNGSLLSTHTLTQAEVNAHTLHITLDTLADTTCVLTSTVTDAHGHESTPSNGLSVTVDNTSDLVTLKLATDTANPNDAATGTDTITSDRTVNVNDLEDTSTFEYSLDGGTTWTLGTGTSFELEADTVYVDNDVQVRSTDVAGNVSTAVSVGAVTTDNTADDVELKLATDTGKLDDDRITKDATVNVGSLESTSTWQYSTDGGTSWNTGEGTSFELEDNTSYIAEQIQVKTIDIAGNEAIVNMGTVTVDTQTVAVKSNHTNDTNFYTFSAVYLLAEEVGASGVDRFEIHDKSGDHIATATYTPTPDAGVTDWNIVTFGDYSVTGSIESGIHLFTLNPITQVIEPFEGNITITTYDVAGNSAVYDTNIDEGERLTVTINDDLVNSTEQSEVEYIVTGLDNETVATLTFTDINEDTVVIDKVEENGNGTVDLTRLADGQITLTVTATDETNNINGIGDTTVLDTQRPSTPTISSITNAGDTNVGTITISGTAEVNSSIKLYSDDTLTNEVGTTTTDTQGAWTTTLTDLTEGAYTFCVTATDSAENTSSTTTASVYIGTTGNNSLTIISNNQYDFIDLGTGTDSIFVSDSITIDLSNIHNVENVTLGTNSSLTGSGDGGKLTLADLGLINTNDIIVINDSNTVNDSSVKIDITSFTDANNDHIPDNVNTDYTDYTQYTTADELHTIQIDNTITVEWQ